MAWMSLDNMRALGPRSIDLYCSCGHCAKVNVDDYPGDTKVPAMRNLFRCSVCGKRPYQSRPNWLEINASGMGRSGKQRET